MQNTTIMSDEFKGYYNILSKKTSHIHLRVDYTKEYVVGGSVHNSNIKNFWGTLKRGILGVYHHVSSQYL
ncbi:MAG: transposase [Rickettsia endosymbiont of Labidopullus appendiculatus]|nr:transposase [Rickettsia endosymbiont of Labidopullus appendiculatus]